ncbi:tetratricopeptide repeat protein 1 [Trichomycterus rosablanca]|uniref:tetratricopeptide repeat protein 1 n=1 Tax=Trichomycterus rosablanca TaxID=2290929 RepID=UPI002F350267
MESKAESLLAAMTDSLKVLDTGGHPDGSTMMKQQEDQFYDCEESLQTETKSLAEQTSINPTKTSHSINPDQEAGERQHTELTTEYPKHPVDTEKPDVDKDSSGESSDEVHQEPLMDNSVPEDDEYESVMREEEKRTDFDSEIKEESAETAEFDDEYLREAEKNLTEEEKESRRAESMVLKEKGNAQFKNQEYSEAYQSYTDALQICPVCYSKERSILFSNRAAARMHLDQKPEAITDCSKAIELNPDYVRAILRRAELYEKTDKLDEALEDYKNVLEKEPGNPTAREACFRLPQQIQERNEKLKEEMLGKLKDLGNMVLRPFGLSTANFQVNQDENTGSYSINFVQKPNNNR